MSHLLGIDVLILSHNNKYGIEKYQTTILQFAGQSASEQVSNFKMPPSY
jgi:hypothetical protein